MAGYKYFVVKAKQVLTKHTQTRVHQGREIWQNSQYFLYNEKGKWKWSSYFTLPDYQKRCMIKQLTYPQVPSQKCLSSNFHDT